MKFYRVYKVADEATLKTEEKLTALIEKIITRFLDEKRKKW